MNPAGHPDVKPYDALLVLSFGGPEKPEDVVPFLENVTRGRGIPRERLEQVGEHYFLFGGRSPINDQNRALIAALDGFEAGGLDALRAEWEAMDAHAGQRLRVRLADGRVITGVAGGLAEDGALRLVTRNGVRAVRSGRVVSARTQ